MYQFAVLTGMDDVEIAVVMVDFIARKGVRHRAGDEAGERGEFAGLVHLRRELPNLGPVVVDRLKDSFELCVPPLGNLSHVRPLALEREGEKVDVCRSDLEGSFQRPPTLPDRVVVVQIAEIQILRFGIERLLGGRLSFPRAARAKRGEADRQGCEGADAV